MKKIAIITTYGQYNYGNRLQNYAVTQIVSKAGGHAETLVLDEKKTRLLLKKYLEQTNLRPVIEGVFLRKRNIGLTYKQFIQFKRFSTRYMTTRYCGGRDMERLSEEYEYFLIGSDQIWNPYFRSRNCDFADFARPEQKIPVAPSFGEKYLTKEQAERIAPLLKEFRYLSVRELSGANIIRELTGREAQILIDPTMLLTRTEWSAISQKPKWVSGESPYIFSYFLGGKSVKDQKQIDQYAQAIGAKEYSLMDPSQPECYVTGPAEFLWLLEHASLVCTNSFHAVVFSVIFDRPFEVFERSCLGIGIDDRISTLLRSMKLEGKLAGFTRQTQNFLIHDYSESYERLEQEKVKFLKYLQMAAPDLNWCLT